MSSNASDPTLAQTDDNNTEKDYELLREDYPNYDLSFKVIVIGNSGNLKLYKNK